MFNKLPWHALMIELFGTLFLSLAIGLSLGAGHGWTPFVAAATLATLIYLGRSANSGHFNPAITLAVMIHGKLSPQNAGLYLLLQLLGALGGAALVMALVQDGSFTFALLPVGSATLLQVLLAELLFTFLLAWGYLHAVTHPANQLFGFSGTAVGLVYLIAWLGIAPISGAVLNPALGTGVNLLSQNYEPIWYYWVAPLLGATLAAFFYRLTAPQDPPRSLRRFFPEKPAQPPAEEEKPDNSAASETEAGPESVEKN